MKYSETEISELKEILTDDVKNEIIAFLNSYLGGTIFIGVSNNGVIKEVLEEEKDLLESKIINWIRDEVIYPNCSEYVHLKFNEDNVLEISIKPGNDKPYYIKEKGLKSSGVYIRYGRNKTQASPEEIKRMIMESKDIYYESLISDEQNLTFKILKLKFEEKNLNFDEFKMKTSGFIRDNKYTNLAFIFSDQYDVDTKIGVYIFGNIVNNNSRAAKQTESGPHRKAFAVRTQLLQMKQNRINTEARRIAMANKQAKQALEQIKMQAASEVGVNLNNNGYNGDLTSRQAGSIGGQMVKKMVEKYENDLKNNK